MSVPQGEVPLDDKQKPNISKSLRTAGPLFGSGIQLAVSAVLMFFVGRWLDDKFGTAPWFMLVGTLFGITAGLYHFIKTANEVSKKEFEQNNNISS